MSGLAMICILSVLVLLQMLTLLSLWLVLLQLMKQQGRFVMRLDMVEDRLSNIVATVSGSQDSVPIVREPIGLAIGTPLENFELPDLDGNQVSLESLRGKPTLLVNWNNECGFCNVIAQDLAASHTYLVKRGIELVLVSQGTPESNRQALSEANLHCTVVIDNPINPQAKCFQNLSTPVAYFIDKTGCVAAFLAVGAQEIPTLLETILRTDPIESTGVLRPDERNGLKVGTPAPTFSLPEVRDGHIISPEHYRGRPLLIVFSDPHCGPCDTAAQELNRYYASRQDHEPDVLMIGRGDIEDNLKKVTAFNLQFPVVAQRRWELSRQFRIYATPVGFLLDENGLVSKEVAQGSIAILNLVGR